MQAAAADAAAGPAARLSLYHAQLSREVTAMVEEVLPTIETNAAQSDEEVCISLL
jgi:hypothetical protein